MPTGGEKSAWGGRIPPTGRLFVEGGAAGSGEPVERRSGATRIWGPPSLSGCGILGGVTESDFKADLRRYLQRGREALLWKLERLSEYDVRRQGLCVFW
jgi:hypothetical protein